MRLRHKTGESSAKAETWWTGPGVVQKRTRDASYEVELHPGELQAVHTDRLKPSVDLYHFEAGYAQEGVTPQLKNILGHRWVAGKPSF